MTCKNCGSLAINHHAHGRDGSEKKLCDVCYWRTKAQQQKLEAIDERLEMQAQYISVIVRLTTERDNARQRITELEFFVRDARLNWDCDSGANGAHPFYCRRCGAAKLLEKEEPK